MLSRTNRNLFVTAACLGLVAAFTPPRGSAFAMMLDDCEDQLLSQEFECSTCNNLTNPSRHYFDENCCEGPDPCYMYPHPSWEDFTCSYAHRPCVPESE